MSRLADRYALLSSPAQDAFGRLASLAEILADQQVRTELRHFLEECADAEVEPAEVEQARIVLAAFDGHLGEPAPDHDVVVLGMTPR